MTGFDWLMLALGVLGIIAPHWVPRMHPWIRNAITLLGLAFLAYSAIVYFQEATHMKIYPGPFGGLIIGILIVAGSIAWQVNMSKAQAPVPPSANVPGAPPVTGMTIQGNSQGGPAVDVTATGSANQTAPAVGLDIRATGAPGQSVTGLTVIQNGPGIGLKSTAGGDGPAIGTRIIVGTPPKE